MFELSDYVEAHLLHLPIFLLVIPWRFCRHPRSSGLPQKEVSFHGVNDSTPVFQQN